jgi:ATP/maltotriose-dependent transcriptional regulator MalT
MEAAARLGIAGEALEQAERAGLLAVTARVHFCDPAARTAVYRAASPDDRQRVHSALAEATDSDIDPDRRAWHSAQATRGPDEAVAAELERSAGRAQHRGGLSAAAAVLERAVALTLDPVRRAQRALKAAEVKHMAGELDAARRLLAAVEWQALDELGRARVEVLRGRIAFASVRDRDVPRLLLEAATRLEPLDVELARETYVDALSAAVFVGHLAGRVGALDVARAVRAAPAAPEPTRATDVLLEGVATHYTQGYVAAAPILRRALSTVRRQDASAEDLSGLWLACTVAATLWDDASWDVLAARAVHLAREAGALTLLPVHLDMRISALTFAGRLDAAASLIEELHAVTGASDSRLAALGPLVVAAWRGREEEASALVTGMTDELAARGDGMGMTTIHWATAALYNGLGRYDDAYAAAERATSHPEHLGFSNWALVELILAAARSGRPAHAERALRQLSELTRASGTDWALGIEARSRALLSEGRIAEGFYLEAIDRLGRTRVRVELARAHLQYGEWLRRERRRLDARDQLRTAQELITETGIEAFARRAARELLATGERARKRSPGTREALTTREIQVACLARDGLSNPEIGRRLFISPRTAEYHLHKVFMKLGVTSRNQLDLVLSREPGVAVAV